MRFWDPASGRQVRALNVIGGTPGDDKTIKQFAISRDRRYMAAVGFALRPFEADGRQESLDLEPAGGSTTTHDRGQDRRPLQSGVLARWWNHRHGWLRRGSQALGHRDRCLSRDAEDGESARLLARLAPTARLWPPASEGRAFVSGISNRAPRQFLPAPMHQPRLASRATAASWR